jgi:hypothetical protein
MLNLNTNHQLTTSQYDYYRLWIFIIMVKHIFNFTKRHLYGHKKLTLTNHTIDTIDMFANLYILKHNKAFKIV